MISRWNWRLCLAAICLVAAGCGSPDAKFVRYSTFSRLAEKAAGYEKNGFTEQQKQDVDNILAALFGTPDMPTLPALPNADITKVVELSKLKLAAGRVGSDETGRPRGLYREHCAHCHGITGDGNGPTATFLNPYPRDYRAGLFKFKSTPIGRRPLHDDLKKIIVDGIPGTAMPSFRLLSDQEIESLVDYVKYLSIRGETERQLYNGLGQLSEKELISKPLMEDLTKEMTEANNGKEPTPKAIEDKVVDLTKEKVEAIKGFADEVVQRWLDSVDLMTQDTAKVSSRNDAMKAFREELVAAGTDEKKLTEEALLLESQQRGRKLFYGPIANCFSCHGPTALGDGQLGDYDGWTVELITKAPTPEIISDFESHGMPKPRNIRPRNLRQGVYRGGVRPLDLYWRVRNGIEGTPMPGNDKLKPEEIWHLVNYVQSLPYEHISNPNDAVPENRRERN
ncbi:MAG: c-type cytochrome [Planctomycetales bacterium]|nr:c-type cytochrome [Planctomycetales bacterium]